MRKQENPRSRRKLLDAAEHLMLAKGFVATSVDEICRKAGLTKGSFFYYFKSKDELGQALLERFCCSTQQQMQECCSGQKNEEDPLKKVYAHIVFAVQMSKERHLSKGCLIGTFAQELADTHPKIRMVCSAGFREWQKLLAKDLKEAKAKYAARSAVDPNSLAEHFIAIIEGSQILARAHQNRRIFERNMNHFREYIEQLFIG